MEREFDGIKAYIWDGGGAPHRFVRERREQFIGDFDRGMMPTHWQHVLAVERSYFSIVAHAQFFLGPRCLPLPYQVSVGGDPRRVVMPRQYLAHLFVYQGADAPEGFDGVMQGGEPHVVRR